MNVLIIAAHPDDEILGCGGTAAKLVKEAYTVRTLILGEGITSRDERRDRDGRDREINELKKSVEAANKIIGVKDAFICDFPDNRFDTVPLLDIIKTIEKFKREASPDIVFTHHHADLNIDHQRTFQAVMTAFRPIKGERVKEIYSFEVPSSTEWNAALLSTCFTPNYFVDISDTLKIKIKAMEKYISEIRDFPHPRSPEAIKVISRRWGIQVGTEAAEAFEVVRIIR
jgi:LmbE family N-acetylglucosaminyl deacetylase